MIVLLKAVGGYPTLNKNTNTNEYVKIRNHIFFAEQHSIKHSLAHTIMTITELIRNDSQMKTFYRYHRPFKQLIVQLYKKYGAKSQFILVDPGISYALNHLMRVLYIKNKSQVSSSSSSSSKKHLSSAQSATSSSSSSSSNNINNKLALVGHSRICSNPDCKNEETKFKKFKDCPSCSGRAAYCSSKCKRAHIDFHLKNECFGSNSNGENVISSSCKPQKYSRIYENSSSLAGGANFQRNMAVRRASENLHQKKNYQLNPAQLESEPKTTGGSFGNEIYQNMFISRSKRLSKYSSMNENHRRVSIATSIPNRKSQLQPIQIQPAGVNPPTKNYYTKHTGSMKEIKSNYANNSRRTLDDDNIRNKLLKNSNQNLIARHPNMDETNTNSIHFVRPLKTSTAVCLTDLTRAPNQEQVEVESPKRKLIEPSHPVTQSDQVNSQNKTASDTSSSTSSSISSAESSSTAQQNPPTSKKFKTLSGQATKNKKENYNKNSEETLLSNENPHLNSSTTLKRRHSATAAIVTTLTTIKKTVTTTKTKTKTKLCEADSTSQAKAPKSPGESGERMFYYGCKEPEMNADYFLYKNGEGETEPVISSDEDEDEDFLSTSTASGSTEKNSKSDKEDLEEEEEEEEEDEEEEIEGERRWVLNDQQESLKNRYAKNKSGEQNGNGDNFYQINEDEEERRSQFKVIKEFEKSLEFVTNNSNLKVMNTNHIFSSTSNSNEQANEEDDEEEEEEEDVFSKLKQDSGMKMPQISLASLCYDENSTLHKENESSSEEDKKSSEEEETTDDDDDEDDDEDDVTNNYITIKATSSSKIDDKPKRRSSNFKRINLIINNSIDSHVNSFHNSNHQMQQLKQKESKMKKSFMHKENELRRHSKSQSPYHHHHHRNLNPNSNEEFVDDEMSLFKNETLLNANKMSDYRSFKTPLININGTAMTSFNDVPLSIKPIITNQSNEIYASRNGAKKAQPKFNELKVNVNTTDILAANNTMEPASHPVYSNKHLMVNNELPKNSTPLFNDSNTAAELINNRKHFLNAFYSLPLVWP